MLELLVAPFHKKDRYGTSNRNGLNSIEVSIKNTVNTVKNNPYTILAIFALLALIGVGYFKRAKFN